MMGRRRNKGLPCVVLTDRELLHLIQLAAEQNPDSYKDAGVRAVIYRAKSIVALGHVWLTVNFDVGEDD